LSFLFGGTKESEGPAKASAESGDVVKAKAHTEDSTASSGDVKAERVVRRRRVMAVRQALGVGRRLLWPSDILGF